MTERIKDRASHSSPLCCLLSERPHFLPRNTRVHACSQQSRVADPELQIRGGGGEGGDPDHEIRGGGLKIFFQPSIWSKNKGEGRAPRAPPLGPPLSLQVKSTREKNVFSQTYLIGVVRAGYKSKQLCQGMGCRIGYLPFFCTCRWN